MQKNLRNLLWLDANGWIFRVLGPVQSMNLLIMLILNLTKTAFGLVNIFKRIKYAARLVHTIMAVIPIARCDAMAIKFSTRKTQDVKPNANENEINFPLRSFSIRVRGRPSVRVLGVGGRKRGMEGKSVGRLVGRSDAKISSSSRITQVQWGCCAFLSFYFSFFSWAAAVLLLPNDICWRCEGRHAIASSRQRVKLCTSVTFLPLLQLLSFTWHHFSQRSPTVAVSFSVYRFYEKRPNEFFFFKFSKCLDFASVECREWRDCVLFGWDETNILYRI